MTRGISNRVMTLTVGLSSFNLFEERLEPAKGWWITTDPKELDATEGTEVGVLLAVPNVLQNGNKRCDTCTDCTSREVVDWADTRRCQHR